jgi:very-short-patch-repair endonuclease
MSPPEARLWTYVRAHRLRGYKFRRQHPIGPYIVDFYCPTAKLAVEIDGRGHEHPEQVEHDRRRTRWLATRGVRVIRIAATDVRDELEGVLEFIARVIRERIADATPPPRFTEKVDGQITSPFAQANGQDRSRSDQEGSTRVPP